MSYGVDMALSAMYTSLMLQLLLSPQSASMKSLLLSCFLASAPILIRAAENPNVNGKWQIRNNISGNESDQTCNFTQKEIYLSGSCTSDKGTVEINGKVNGKKITWSYKSDYQGTPLTVNYEGVLDSASKIVGNVSVPEFSADGDFSATQSR